ncbi:MAG: 4-hydroxy-tetrahydrodipicolinate synthase [Acidimicrobiales bacterium]|nr:4-hydroxy-tetrahydrodipicolinate synthase [Acidimicrobiales bacterium]
MARFGRVLTAMATPFAADGALDLDGAATLARWLVDHGNDGVVVAGTTGESPTLTAAEHLDLIRTVREAVPDAIVIGGAGSNDTTHAMAMTRTATDMGVDGILSVTPYYNKPSQAGLLAHWAAIAESTDRPIMLYDIPGRTGRKIESATMLALAEAYPNVVAVKDAAGNPGATAALLARAPEGFEVYSGDDNMTLPLLAAGAVGVVGVATHWVAGLMAQMIEAFEAGKHDEARRLNALMIPSFEFETGDAAPNPVPTKAMLRLMGLPGGACRPPMGPEPDGLEDIGRALLDELGY